MRVRSHALSAAVTTAAVASLGSAQSPALPASVDSLTNATFAPALGVDLTRSVRLPSGVYVRELARGQGDSLRAGARLALHFRVHRADGTAVADVQSSTESSPWFPGTYVRGVEAGFAGMQAGGRRQLVVPATLAYGGRGAGSVPANTPLVVEIDLAAVR